MSDIKQQISDSDSDPDSNSDSDLGSGLEELQKLYDSNIKETDELWTERDKIYENIRCKKNDIEKKSDSQVSEADKSEVNQMFKDLRKCTIDIGKLETAGGYLCIAICAQSN